jgi:mono/diheme cytochrome c family protein
MAHLRLRLALAALAISLLIRQDPVVAASIDNGRQAFVHHGCWQCHGFEGQGSAATSGGKVIADTALPPEAFSAFVRTTNGAMPPFSKKILSDGDLADIYAYLESRPKPKMAKDVPLLNEVR